MKLLALIADASDADGFPAGAIKTLEEVVDDASVPAGYVEVTEEEVTANRALHAVAVTAWTQTQRLGVRKREITKQYKKDIRDFVERRYSAATQRTLTMLMQIAVAENDNAKVNQLRGVTAWIGACVQRYYAARDAVTAATTADELEAVTLDLSGLAESDPAVDLEDVL